MSDRRVLAVSAACITAAIFLFLLGTFPSWKAAIGDASSWSRETRPGSSVPSDARPRSEARTEGRDGDRTDAPAVKAEVPPATSQASPSMPPAAAPDVSAPSGGAPSFDIVRVEPSGDSVIAARTRPGSTVTLLDQGRPIAQARADGSGQVAFVPPPLGPGDHSLMLSLGEPNSVGALSSQSVAVSVPAQAKAAPMVALLQPDAPTRVLAAPSPTGSAGAATAAPSVSVGAIDVEEMGSVFATGHAPPGSQCRVYLNGSFVANVAAGADGTWSLKIERGMKPGHYSVRIDQLASAAGDVKARAEVPFDYPARAAASVSLLRPRKGTAALPVAPTQAAGPAQAMGAAVPPVSAPSTQGAGPTAAQSAHPPAAQVASASANLADPPVPALPGVPTVVAQLVTTKVVHGDSLWRISRKMLGHGRRYTQIYAANTTQIRDPGLIYPGQIFVLPQAAN